MNNETSTPATDFMLVDEFDELLTQIFANLEALARAGAYGRLDALARQIDRRHLPEAVRVAREYGTPWSEIGEELGVSRQAAQQRFSS